MENNNESRGVVKSSGQQHWERVNEGGIFIANTAEDLWKNAIAYFKWCDDNPIIVKRTITSGKAVGTKVDQETPRPYTVKGLCLHCGVLEGYLMDVRRQKAESSIFYNVVSKILYIIYVQNSEMAAIGVYNSQFIMKMLGMGGEEDTVAAPITINVVQGLPELSTSENEILEKLDLEKEFLKK